MVLSMRAILHVFVEPGKIEDLGRGISEDT